MKLIFLAALLLMATFSFSQSLSVNANEPAQPAPGPSFSAKLISDTDSTFILQIENPLSKRLNVSLRHATLGTVLDTTIYQARYHCRYLFDMASDGRYVVSITTGKEKVEYKVDMSTVTTVRRSVTVL